MRFWLVLLLTLSFSLQGWATAGAGGAPCLMEEDLAGIVSVLPVATDGASPDAGAEDCCNDLATFVKTGQTCKSGQDCHQSAVPFVFGSNTHAGPSQAFPSAEGYSTPPAMSVAVWRPPTSI